MNDIRRWIYQRLIVILYYDIVLKYIKILLGKLFLSYMAGTLAEYLPFENFGINEFHNKKLSYNENKLMFSMQMEDHLRKLETNSIS